MQLASVCVLGRCVSGVRSVSSGSRATKAVRRVGPVVGTCQQRSRYCFAQSRIRHTGAEGGISPALLPEAALVVARRVAERHGPEHSVVAGPGRRRFCDVEVFFAGKHPHTVLEHDLHKADVRGSCLEPIEQDERLAVPLVRGSIPSQASMKRAQWSNGAEVHQHIVSVGRIDASAAATCVPTPSSRLPRVRALRARRPLRHRQAESASARGPGSTPGVSAASIWATTSRTEPSFSCSFKKSW